MSRQPRILTDGTHLVSLDDPDHAHLHAFARRLGLKLVWFQDHPRHPHYDLTTISALARARLLGAEVTTRQELVRLMRAQP